MIGDSISIGMHQDVFSALESHGIASAHNYGNAANSNKGARCLESFLGGANASRWDVISFQFGLHDLAYDTELLTTEQYEGLLTNITTRISALGKQTVWVTTTPVPDAPVNPPRYNRDVITLNAIAHKVVTSIIPSSRLTVVDLYSWVIARCGVGYKTCPIQLPNNVHYTTEGWQYLSKNMTAGVLSAFDRLG